VTTGTRQRSAVDPIPQQRQVTPVMWAFLQGHAPRLTRYLISTGCPPQDAEEYTNDGCRIVVDRWDRLLADPKYGGRPPRAYLYKVTTQLWHRHGPREKTRREALVDLSDSGFDVLQVVSNSDEIAVDRVVAARIVQSAFSKMPMPERQVLWLRHAEDFSTKATAGILDIPEGTVKYRLSLAIDHFKPLAIAAGELEGIQWNRP
jgi:RNA polymerase sigma factor (sigma-70 family)